MKCLGRAVFLREKCWKHLYIVKRSVFSLHDHKANANLPETKGKTLTTEGTYCACISELSLGFIFGNHSTAPTCYF